MKKKWYKIEISGLVVDDAYRYFCEHCDWKYDRDRVYWFEEYETVVDMAMDLCEHEIDFWFTVEYEDE